MNNKRLKPIMFVGTGSDVGKSVINAAFCRIFLQDGHHPAPFKAQNMSLNSYVTKDELEIGRAQAMQAEACGIDCMVEMNPILLKPNNNVSAQIVLNGKPAGNKSASEYFEKTDRDALFSHVTVAFDRLNAQYSPIVLEGAGSISEVNLWDKDIVNMRMGMYADAAVYLIADIDRGGVFGSVYGSMLLLPENERKQIKGVIINKFRGDINLFREGQEMLKNLTGVPVVGVIPYFRDIFIEQEDSVVLDSYKTKSSDKKISIAVTLLKHMSNFTDFNILERHPEIQLFYAATPNELENADIVIIPGSKNTISDLQYLRSSGMAKAIMEHHKKDKPLYGICGGFQIMGEMIYDPKNIEGDIEAMAGLGILPVSTTLADGKTTRQCKFNTVEFEAYGAGYEIHSGVTNSDKPFSILDNGKNDGYFLNEKTWGTYIHGVFDNPTVITRILQQVNSSTSKAIDYKELKEEGFNRLADWVRKNVDMDYIYKTMEL